jgi:hypothetical protein
MAAAQDTTVTLTGMQPHWAAGLLEDQVLAAWDDFRHEIDCGLCQGPFGAEKSSEAFTAALERLFDLRSWLDLIEYGHAKGPIEVPVSVLFPGQHG